MKKFKALFDASDPTRAGAGSFDEDVLLGTGGTGATTSQTQSQTQGFVRRPAVGSSLAVLREEEEESQTPGGEAQQRGTKRSLNTVQEDRDVEMVDVDGEGEVAEPVRKRQALEDVNSVERSSATATTGSLNKSSPKSNKKERNLGAPVGKPDTDVEFLKAVASTKKGKRAEDAFDREFNNLRISKPKLGEVDEERQREEEEEWRRFTDFGDDAGLRGNFMVVMEMDVFRREKGGEVGTGERTGQAGKEREVPEQWRDKPNFKKFKKVRLVLRNQS